MGLSARQIVNEVRQVKADTVWSLSTARGEIFCETIDKSDKSIIVDGELIDLSENAVYAITGYPDKRVWESRRSNVYISKEVTI